MSLYVFCGWIICIITSVLLVLSIWNKRYLLVKPSIMVIIFFHLMIQWAATIDAGEIYLFLPDPWSFLLLAHGFPLIGLVFSLSLGRRLSQNIWNRILHPAYPASGKYMRKVIIGLVGYFAIYLPLYFSYVPFSSTGLYTIFVDPMSSMTAREYSLKLVDSALVQYGYAFMIAIFAPLLAIFLFQIFRNSLGKKRLFVGIGALVGIGGVLLAVSLTGARGNSAYIIMAILFAEWLRRGAIIRPLYLGSIALAVLALPTLLSIYRTGQQFSLNIFWQHLVNGIFNRIFYMNMQTGLLFAHYAQTYGLMGIQAMPKVARLLGMTPINAPNLIARFYFPGELESTIANTSTVFAYYAYFGIISLPVSLLGLWSLDLALSVYKRISDGILLPCVAAVGVASTALISTEYTILLLTYGFLGLLIVAWIIDKRWKM